MRQFVPRIQGSDRPPRPTPRCAAALQDGRSRCLQASDPDETGRYNAGLGIEHLQAAIGRARLVIAQVNPELPWTYGDTAIEPAAIDVLEGVSRDARRVGVTSPRPSGWKPSWRLREEV